MLINVATLINMAMIARYPGKLNGTAVWCGGPLCGGVVQDVGTKEYSPTPRTVARRRKAQTIRPNSDRVQERARLKRSRESPQRDDGWPRPLPALRPLPRQTQAAPRLARTLALDPCLSGPKVRGWDDRIVRVRVPRGRRARRGLQAIVGERMQGSGLPGPALPRSAADRDQGHDPCPCAPVGSHAYLRAQDRRGVHALRHHERGRQAGRSGADPDAPPAQPAIEPNVAQSPGPSENENSHKLHRDAAKRREPRKRLPCPSL